MAKSGKKGVEIRQVMGGAQILWQRDTDTPLVLNSHLSPCLCMVTVRISLLYLLYICTISTLYLNHIYTISKLYTSMFTVYLNCSTRRRAGRCWAWWPWPRSWRWCRSPDTACPVPAHHHHYYHHHQYHHHHLIIILSLLPLQQTSSRFPRLRSPHHP